MKFSICIPNYNYERYLGRTIQSILDHANRPGSRDAAFGVAALAAFGWRRRKAVNLPLVGRSNAAGTAPTARYYWVFPTFLHFLRNCLTPPGRDSIMPIRMPNKQKPTAFS